MNPNDPERTILAATEKAPYANIHLLLARWITKLFVRIFADVYSRFLFDKVLFKGMYLHSMLIR